ncbi:MAG TPA: SDR family oxidoreductase [Gaiellaceae bacterium]|nr:SDR family oxidoreductase [Gaiellaceae bacterium]
MVVTGASAGVGRAAARAFALRGASVGLLARGSDGLDAAHAEVGAGIAIPTDVADADAVERAAEQVEAELGPIDVWVNNAMATVFSRFADLTADEFRRATEVTYLGTVHGTMAALQRMLPRNRGTIVQVGSALAHRSIPLQAAYCGAKAAVRGFTDSVRCELLHERSRVHVTMVQLPALNTPQFELARSRLPRRPRPVPPIYQPEVAAEAIVWAASRRRREVFVGGPTLLAIVGNRLAPTLGDLYLARTAYEAQQTLTPVEPEEPDNLFRPVPGDHGARGPFDDEAKERSLQLWLTRNRGWLAGGGLALAALARRR